MASFRVTWLRRGNVADASPPLLLAENLRKALARSLRSAGFDVQMVEDRMRGRVDAGIWEVAERAGRCIVTRGWDFVRLAQARIARVGVVYFRFQGRPDLTLAAIDAALPFRYELRGAILQVELV